MKVAAGMAVTGFFPVTGKASSKEQTNHTFVHHVFFWLKEPQNADACAEFEQGLQALVTVPHIKSYHIGRPVQSPREVVDDSFTYSYMAFFSGKEDQDAYQTHPIHLKFVEDCQHLWEKVVVYDAMD